jgi:hypothetical protein
MEKRSSGNGAAKSSVTLGPGHGPVPASDVPNTPVEPCIQPVQADSPGSVPHVDGQYSTRLNTRGPVPAPPQSAVLVTLISPYPPLSLNFKTHAGSLAAHPGRGGMACTWLAVAYSASMQTLTMTQSVARGFEYDPALSA